MFPLDPFFSQGKLVRSGSGGERGLVVTIERSGGRGNRSECIVWEKNTCLKFLKKKKKTLHCPRESNLLLYLDFAGVPELKLTTFFLLLFFLIKSYLPPSFVFALPFLLSVPLSFSFQVVLIYSSNLVSFSCISLKECGALVQAAWSISTKYPHNNVPLRTNYFHPSLSKLTLKFKVELTLVFKWNVGMRTRMEE